MIRLHPSSIKSRHLVAPLFVLSLLLLPILGIWLWPAWVLLAIELIAYFALAIYFATKISLQQESGLRMMLLLPIVFFTLHITWGVSFLLSVVQPASERNHCPYETKRFWTRLCRLRFGWLFR